MAMLKQIFRFIIYLQGRVDRYRIRKLERKIWELKKQLIKNNKYMTLEYVQPTPEQIEVMQNFRTKMGALYTEIDELPTSRGKSLALTKLEECSMWLNKAITNNS